MSTNPICKAVDVIQRFMRRNQYALYEGSIYRKAPESAFTSVYCCPVKDFLMRSLSNPEIADSLAQCINSVTSLLSNSSCRMIKPLIIDYNLIEVLPTKTCFHITGKFFKLHEAMKPGVSPRAFVKYEYKEDRVPYPMPFIQGTTNIYFFCCNFYNEQVYSY